MLYKSNICHVKESNFYKDTKNTYLEKIDLVHDLTARVAD